MKNSACVSAQSHEIYDNYSYSKTSSVQGDLEWAISKLSELIEKDFDLSMSLSDNDIYESCMKDRECIKDKNGVNRVPLGEKDQNTVLYEEWESEADSDFKDSVRNISVYSGGNKESMKENQG